MEHDKRCYWRNENVQGDEANRPGIFRGKHRWVDDVAIILSARYEGKHGEQAVEDGGEAANVLVDVDTGAEDGEGDDGGTGGEGEEEQEDVARLANGDHKGAKS